MSRIEPRSPNSPNACSPRPARRSRLLMWIKATRARTPPMRRARDPTRSRQTPGSEERLRPLASPMGGRAKFWLAVSIPPVSERLRAITGNPGRSALPGLRYSDVKERRGNTDLKLITRSNRDQHSDKSRNACDLENTADYRLRRSSDELNEVSASSEDPIVATIIINVVIPTRSVVVVKFDTENSALVQDKIITDLRELYDVSAVIINYCLNHVHR